MLQFAETTGNTESINSCTKRGDILQAHNEYGLY